MNARLVAAALALLAIAACGGSDRSDPTPATVSPPATTTPSVTVSLVAPADSTVTEADDPTLEIGVTLSAAASAAVTVPIEYSGSATRDRDYAAGADTLEIPSGAVSASFEIDVFRDFDDEDDETLTIGLGAPQGPAEAGTPSSVTLTLLDGGGAIVETPFELPPEPDATFFPVHQMITGESVVLGFTALNTSTEHAATLAAEWSTDFEFLTDVHALGTVDIPPADPQLDPFDQLTQFTEPQEFTLPLRDLAPDGAYFVRVYLEGAGAEGSDGEDMHAEEYLFSFATDAQGHVVTRCEPPERTAGPAGTDPLFAEQWHLINTGQTAFSQAPGVAGADLRMAGAIGAGRDGDGVTLAVVDTGLEICHPDLAGSVAEGRSFNFAFAFTAGASASDPFNPDLFGDHGTGVAGVAAAVAGNGLGGRGVAPGVELVGFNAGTAASSPDAEDLEAAFFKALGASERDPDSASVDVFNMSFGTELPSENATEDFVRLMKMGTGELRGGLGALYVKAAGNEFGVCYRTHPLNGEIGCFGSNSDPDQNLPYLVSVGAFNADDVKSSYSSAGANLWVVGPAGEDGIAHPGIITTDQAGTRAGFDHFVEQPLGHDHPQNRDGDYMNVFGGTSSAAPAVAGAVAILLGVNPDLTWRDVKHVLAASARRIDPERARVRAAFNGRPYVAQHAWQTNAAGYPFHNWYGFGAMDVDEAIALAASHAPDSLGGFVESDWFSAGEELALAIPDADGAGAADAVSVTGLPDSANIEAVILRITVEHDDAWDLGVTVTSPAGTESVVNAPFNALLDDFPGLLDWELMSNAFYGENPNGEWRVRVVDLHAGDTGELSSWGLRLHYGEHP